MLKVSIIGGLGKMGQQTIQTIESVEDMEVAHVIDVNKTGTLQKIGDKEYLVENNLDEAAESSDVFIDFTGPFSVKENADKIISLGKNLIIGATGIVKEDIDKIGKMAEENNCGVMIIPNFAIGAVLMMEFSRMAAKYFNEAEVIEYHHTAKLDAPSGTAIKTAELIKSVKDDGVLEKGKEILEGARGATIGDVHIHSVRLSGFVASQEVIFGGLGQSLKIRHDSINRESFMPGVLLVLRKIQGVRGLIYGLENLLKF